MADRECSSKLSEHYLEKSFITVKKEEEEYIQETNLDLPCLYIPESALAKNEYLNDPLNLPQKGSEQQGEFNHPVKIEKDEVIQEAYDQTQFPYIPESDLFKEEYLITSLNLPNKSTAQQLTSAQAAWAEFGNISDVGSIESTQLLNRPIKEEKCTMSDQNWKDYFLVKDLRIVIYRCAQAEALADKVKTENPGMNPDCPSQQFKVQKDISNLMNKKMTSVPPEVIATHTDEKRHSCDFCSARFKQKSDLVIHVRTHTGEKPFKCEFCSACFTQRGNLVRHIRVHSGEKPFECTACSARFSEGGSLAKHIRTHTGEKPFECSYCLSKFSRRSYLVDHIRTHMPGRPYVCKSCSASFSLSSSLARHMRTHSDEKPHLCNFCSATFTHRGSLVRHIRTHTGEKPYECEFCSARFIDRTSLVHHTRTHTGEKPFGCSSCSARFARRIHLINHIRTHTGEKPFECNSCSAVFSQRTHLVIHIRTHTGEKPFGCSSCPARFAQRNHLISHIRHNHPVE